MSYTQPTVSIFKIRHPEFANVNNELVSLVLNEAVSTVGDGWLEKDRAKAQMLLAAHTLAMEGEPQRSNSLSNGGVANSPALGQVIEMQDRDVKVKVSDKQQQVSENSSLGEIGKGFMQTSYGREYYLLLRRNAPSMCVV